MSSTPERTEHRYSVVIPVYNSEQIVGTTVERILEVGRAHDLDLEIILVNDGSPDGSWGVISKIAETTPSIIALDLLHNYGQHYANLAGLRESTGDYVVTMDDDLQNPPEELPRLIDEALTGKDAVFGKFEAKQHAGYRRLGSKLIGTINRRIFHQPPWLTVSNYRVLRRDVVDRICASNAPYPYLTGQALLYSRNPSNVTVRHDPRPVGSSNYSMWRILRLVMTILFSYSVYPLRLAAGIGFAIALGSFVLGMVFLLQGLLGETRVQGWTTIVVLLAMANGVVIALLSMLGEYVVRTLNAVSTQDRFHVSERVGR